MLTKPPPKRLDSEVPSSESPSRRWRFPASPFPMWIFDLASGVIVAANDAAITAYGYTRNELLERSLGDLCANREETDELFASVASGSWDGKLELRRKDLTTFTANVAILRTGDPPNAGMVIATPVRESATLAPRGSC